jgi:adenosylhomocysteine nucleosidase
MNTIAIIAALDRELQPLIDADAGVGGWKPSSFVFQGKTFRVFEQKQENLVAVAGGIGSRAAELAARAVVAQYRPYALISAGLAGGLIRSLKVGCIVTPNVIMDARTGNEYRCTLGEGLIAGGVLVSAGEIAGQESKQKLVQNFHALAVDMEAAAVAEVARDAEIGFCCVKAISDEFNFSMLPLDQFVTADGNFLTGKFATWAALRPWTWPRVIALGRNSNRATRELCDWLKAHVTTSLRPGRVVRLEPAPNV